MGYSVYYQGEITLDPPLSKEHAAVVLAVGRKEKTEQTRPIFAAIAASDVPYHAGLFDLSEDGRSLVPEEEESRHGLALWLTLLIEHFFRPSGYVLNGAISWNGEEAEDRGSICVKDNQLEMVDDIILYPGPSWSPEHYADSHLKQIIRELIDSADGAGCSPDLTVVSAKPVEALRSVLPRL